MGASYTVSVVNACAVFAKMPCGHASDPRTKEVLSHLANEYERRPEEGMLKTPASNFLSGQV